MKLTLTGPHLKGFRALVVGLAEPNRAGRVLGGDKLAGDLRRGPYRQLDLRILVHALGVREQEVPVLGHLDGAEPLDAAGLGERFTPAASRRPQSNRGSRTES
ncbi:MAG: hypothetical protein ACR2GZ_05385 [Solirubrobacteraceae bacterium]